MICEPCDKLVYYVEEIDDFVYDDFYCWSECVNKRGNQRTKGVFQVLCRRGKAVHACRKRPVYRLAPLVRVLNAFAESVRNHPDCRTDHAIHDYRFNLPKKV